MSDWETQYAIGFEYDLGALSSFGSCSPFGEVAIITGSTPASAAWPSANLAIFVPVIVNWPTTVYAFGVFNGATASGNWDCGLYDALGNQLGHTGSTVQSGLSTAQVVSVTNFTIGAGLYYIAMSMDNITGTVFRTVFGATNAQATGIQQMAAALPLPATATFANPTTTTVPVCWAVTGASVL